MKAIPRTLVPILVVALLAVACSGDSDAASVGAEGDVAADRER